MERTADRCAFTYVMNSRDSLTPSLPTSVAATLRGFAIYPAVAQPAVFILRASRLCHGLPARFTLVRSMRFRPIVAVAFAFALGVGDLRSDEGATPLPPNYGQYLKGKLSPDADKVISVIGAKQNPYTIPPTQGLTVSKAIELAGGFPDFAERRRVGVWRAKEARFFKVDVKAVLQRNPDANDPLLEAGDVVIVVMRLILH